MGVRAEGTDVTTTLKQTNDVNPRSYANLFPSVHATYDLPRQHALQISYSRRVRRPQYNDLHPFMTFSDNRNFFSGNPDLNPEFTNAFEIGHSKYVEKGSMSFVDLLPAHNGQDYSDEDTNRGNKYELKR